MKRVKALRGRRFISQEDSFLLMLKLNFFILSKLNYKQEFEYESISKATDIKFKILDNVEFQFE